MFSLTRFSETVKAVAEKHEAGVRDEQQVLDRAAESVILLYSAAAVLSRAGAAKEGEGEVLLLAESWCKDAHCRVGRLLEAMEDGRGTQLDRRVREVGRDSLRKGGYCSTSPVKLS